MRTFAAEQSWLFCQECNDLTSYPRPGSGQWAGKLKVAHIRNTYQPHRITGLFRRQRISLTQPNGSDVVVPAPDKNLRHPKWEHVYCRRLDIAFRNIDWLPSKHFFDYRAMAPMLFKLDKRLHVSCSCEIDDAANGQWIFDIKSASARKTSTSCDPHGQM